MHGAGGEQRGDRRAALVNAAVGEDENAGPISDGRFRVVGDSLDHRLESFPDDGVRVCFRYLKQGGDRGRRDTIGGEALDGVHRGIVDGDARDLEQSRLIGRLFEEIAAAADEAVKRHDLTLAQ
jgi:hypothetical protein